ncbi:hypothetical protein OS493_032332 [Desmophyllum pertusum]|uniref:Uncharacterized protein n=1 Tax=Desmophyllum pertusum TaxID=174260 RepID=A0A9W9YVX2_9CNID|nr:hypothetical protein OS493_032332 [Desmophyllum pertusum]
MRITTLTSVFILRSRKAFFLTVVAVATVIYLGTFRDYFSLTQYAAVAPKGDIPVQSESESTGRVNQAYNLSPLKKPYEIGEESDSLGSEIRLQYRDETYVADMPPSGISVAEIFDVPTNETTGELEEVFQTQKADASPTVQGSTSKTTQFLPSNNDDESGDDDDDDEDHHDDDDDHDVKKNEFSIDPKHRNDDNDDDDDEGKDKGRDDGDDDDDDDDDEESHIGDHHIWSVPLPQKETTDIPRNPKRTMINSTRYKPLQSQIIVNSPIAILANLSGTTSKIINVDESRQHLTAEELNAQVNRSFQSSERILNLTDADSFTRSPIVQSLHQILKKHGSHRALRFPPVKPIPPPVGFSSKPAFLRRQIFFPWIK